MTKDIFLSKLAQPHTITQLIGWVNALPRCAAKTELVADLKWARKTALTSEDVDSLAFLPPPVSAQIQPPIVIPVEKVTETQDQVEDAEKAKAEAKESLKEYKAAIKPTTYKKGDVFMHPIFRHPCILLDYRDGHWICGLLTTDEDCAELLEQCNSRMFSQSYFTKTIFTVKEPMGKFMSVFDNATQVRAVLKKLRRVFN